MLVHDFFTDRMPFLSHNSVRKHWRDGNIDKHHDTRGVFVEQRLDSGGLKDWPVNWTNWAKISDRVTDDLETAGCCPVSMAAVYTVSDSNCANVSSFVAVMVRDCIERFRLPLPAVSEFYICRQSIVFVRWLTCVIFSPKYSHVDKQYRGNKMTEPTGQKSVTWKLLAAVPCPWLLSTQ